MVAKVDMTADLLPVSTARIRFNLLKQSKNMVFVVHITDSKLLSVVGHVGFRDLLEPSASDLSVISEMLCVQQCSYHKVWSSLQVT